MCSASYWLVGRGTALGWQQTPIGVRERLSERGGQRGGVGARFFQDTARFGLSC